MSVPLCTTNLVLSVTPYHQMSMAIPIVLSLILSLLHADGSLLTAVYERWFASCFVCFELIFTVFSGAVSASA